MAATVLPFRARDETPEADGPPKTQAQLKTQFTNAVSSKNAENTEAAEAERYFHGVQWTKEELKILKDRNQPPVTFNRIKRKINTVVGIIEKLRQDPKAYPRTPNPAAGDGAELATKVVRYALGWDWDDTSTNVARRCGVRGIWGVECVLTQGDQGDPEVEWDEVDHRDFFYDPRSSKHDFSDARFMGTSRWIDLDEAVTQWPDHEDELTSYVENGPTSDWERGDERNRLAWLNKPERQVRIVDHWYMVGKTWHYAIYCGSHILEFGESPYRDHKKRSTQKFEMMSCDIDQDNDRYGFYRDLRSPQDEVNHRRSKALHALNSRRVIADQGAVDDVELARREFARVDGWVIKNPGKEINTDDQVTAAQVQGNLEMLQEAKAEIDTYGPNPGLIGTEIPAESGRAIQLLQAAGIAELGTFIKTYKHWKLRVYRKTWCAVQQFWTAPRFIRVSDDPKLEQFVQLNGWQKDEAGFPVAINQLAALDVDIIIDEGADTINSMADTFDTLVMLAKNGAQIPPEVFIELSSLPQSTKASLMQKLTEAQQPKPIDQQAIMLKLQEVQTKIENVAADTQLKLAQAQKAATPEGGSPPQIDTPADLAKAQLDQAKAAEIMHKIEAGVHVPDVQPGLFDLNAAKTRQAHAAADASEAQATKTALEAATIAEAPAGMLQAPPPRPANAP